MNKKSFILYQDYRQHLDLIENDADFRTLIEAIFDFADGKNVEQDLFSPLVKMAFSFISSKLHRDIGKYKNICDARRTAGSKGGVAKAANAKVAKQIKQKVASVADSDNDSDNDSDSDNDNDNDNDTKENIIKESFSHFYSNYPKHKDKERALTSYKKALKASKLPVEEFEEMVLRAVLNQKREREMQEKYGRTPEYWKYPATWLNGKNWEDEVNLDEKEVAKNASKGKPNSGNAYTYADELCEQIGC